MSLQRAAFLVASGLLLGGLLTVSPTLAVDNPGEGFHVIPVSEGSGVHPADRPVSATAAQLMATYPGLRISTWSNRVLLYGKPMTSGETPDQAVTEWLSLYSDAFGVDNPEISFDFVAELTFGKFTVYGFHQTINGVEVQESRGRILVLNDADRPVVVYAAAELHDAPPVGSELVFVDADEALMTVQGVPAYAAALQEWTKPEQVILPPYYDNALTQTVLAWRVSGHTTSKKDFRGYTFYVDAATGDIVHIRSDVHHVDVDGHASALATPGTKPDGGANPPVVIDLEGARARIGGTSVLADESGNFTIPNGGTGPVTVFGDLEGMWCNCINVAGADHEISTNVTPPGPADLNFNQPASPLVTAQINAFHHTTGIHEFWKDRQPTYTELDQQLTTNANLDNSCNAFFTTSGGLSINFFTPGGGCVNTAYSSVVYHEYGHYIVNRLGLSQGAFGEGFGDTQSVLAFNNPIVGEDFFGAGQHIRHIVNANVQFPCGGQIHFCGQALAGSWWDIKLEFENSFGGSLGLQATRQLMTDWALITLGGQGSDAAHPQTAIEVITADDNDGDIGNGSPNYGEICGGFAEHNINCPPLPDINFEFPSGLPTALTPGISETVEFNVVPVVGTPIAGSGEMFVSIDNGPFTSASVNQTSPNQYEATIPAVACEAQVEFYFQADAAGGGTETSPSNAPAGSYVAQAGVFFPLLDNMETNMGWSVGAPGDDATTGIWERVNPVGTDAQPEDDHTPNPGVLCFVTGQQPPGGGLGTNDVDNGQTTLTTPVMDMSAIADYTISYWRWYNNEAGAAPNTDIFVIDISNNGGSTWVNVETIGPVGAGTSGGWIFNEFNVADFVAPTANMRMRFIASDEGDGSIVEAAIDDFSASYTQCGPSEPYTRGDCNQDTTRNISDPITLLDGVFGGGGLNFTCDDACDANDDGSIGLPDAVSMLNGIFLGQALPEPFPGCGVDTTDDGLDCAISGVCP